MNTPDPEEPLSRTLADWRVTPPRHSQFRPQVWARIAAARAAPTWPGYVRAHATRVAGVLALAIVVGAMTGRERARARVEAESGRLATSYVQALDARNMRMP